MGSAALFTLTIRLLSGYILHHGQGVLLLTNDHTFYFSNQKGLFILSFTFLALDVRRAPVSQDK